MLVRGWNTIQVVGLIGGIADTSRVTKSGRRARRAPSRSAGQVRKLPDRILPSREDASKQSYGYRKQVDHHAMFRWGHGAVQKSLRTVLALAILFEAVAFFLGAMLHLGVSLPLPYHEVASMRFAFLEALTGALLLIAFGAGVLRQHVAWKIAVGANVVGVAITAYVTAVGRSSPQSSHHQPMLILLIVVLVRTPIPRCRQALENGRHVRRRRRILQAL